MQDLVAKSLKLVGRVLGDKFRLTACIGIGGSGAVYKADQIALGRTVAVKILNEELSADSRMIARFRGEATSASRLNHPNCVSIIDYGQAPDGLLYLAMEYVKGPTLTQLLVNESPLGLDRVLDIIAQTLHGIEDAHLAGVVHADLKADNIILDQRRAGVDTVKIVDFGIARLVTGARDAAEDRTISGTPEYMAPEVIGGSPPSFASDLYAVGIILYELLVERTPFFASSTTEILTNHMMAQPQIPTSRRAQIPREVDAVIGKALAKRPADRYASAAEMREAIVGIRARLRHAPADKCVSCGSSCQPTWKFCPECGTPRLQIAKTMELAAIESVLPLPFTGRDEELHALVQHLTRPASGNSGLLVVGPEGSGRTSLMRRAYEQVAGDERTIIQVGPDPTGLAAPFYPIRSLLAAVLNLPPAATAAGVREAVIAAGLGERDVPGVSQLFGHPTALLELEPPVRRRELVWSALRVLERGGNRIAPAGRSGIAIACEDIDRYDQPSLEVLRRAAESKLVLPPIAMSATIAAAGQWPSSMARLEVGALDGSELESIVRAIGGRVRGLPTAQQLFETTRAYPGHLDHVVRYLLEGGKAEDTKVSLPDLIAARLSMLARETREALQAAAVLGVEPSEDVLHAMLPGDSLQAALADAEQHGLLARDDRDELAFTSWLVREIVYDATPADVRRSLHAQAAAASQRDGADAGVLGHHHDLAGHAREAVELLRRAGDHAVDQLDDTGASQLYYRALLAVRAAVRSGDIGDGAEVQFVELSVKLADVLRARGETALARGILAEARDWASLPKFSAALDRASAAIAISEGDGAGAVAALRRGVGRAIGTGDMNLACELYLDLSSALLGAGDASGANRELVECIDLATLGEGIASLDGPEPLWKLLRAQAQIVVAEGDSYRALRLAEAALFHAQRVRSRLGAARMLQLLASLCEKIGLDAKAERYRQQAIAAARVLGDRRATAELLVTDDATPTGDPPSFVTTPTESDLDRMRRKTEMDPFGPPDDGKG